MYAQLTEDAGSPLEGVIYIADRHDVARLVRRNAASMGLDSLSLRTLGVVVHQTQEAASAPVE